DFGLAKLLLPADQAASQAPTLALQGVTSPGLIAGTAGYMSPEQAAGKELDVRSDQFSFGSILYEMAAGKPPFRRGTVVQTLSAIIQDEPEPIATQIPAPLRWIIERCLSKEPDGRYASTRDLARELQTLRNHLSEATSVTRSLAAARPHRRG